MPTVLRSNIEPPISRFLTAEVADLRIKDIGELLQDYKRIAEILQRNEAFG